MRRGDPRLDSFLDELSKMAAIAAGQVRRGTKTLGSFDDFSKRLRRGDVIVTKPSARGRGSILSPLIAAYDKATSAKHPGWIHTAVYLGDGKIGHLDDKKLKRRGIKEGPPSLGQDQVDLFGRAGYDLLALRPKSEEVAERAATRMDHLSSQGHTSSSGKYLKNLLRTGFNRPGEGIKDAVCTGIVGDAFRGARLSKRDPLVMRPKDFLESGKLRHAVAYSKDRGAPHG